MAESKFYAKRRTNIGGVIFEAGAEIKGVSAARCEHLRGRVLETDGDRKDAADAAKKAAADAKKNADK